MPFYDSSLSFYGVLHKRTFSSHEPMAFLFFRYVFYRFLLLHLQCALLLLGRNKSAGRSYACFVARSSRTETRNPCLSLSAQTPLQGDVSNKRIARQQITFVPCPKICFLSASTLFCFSVAQCALLVSKFLYTNSTGTAFDK